MKPVKDRAGYGGIIFIHLPRNAKEMFNWPSSRRGTQGQIFSKDRNAKEMLI